MASMGSKQRALAFKAEGNKCFQAKNYDDAIKHYTDAIEADGSDVTYFSNRSACFAALEKWEEAADDGRQCIMVDKSFIKGYFRQATGLKNMGNVEAAIDVCKRGLGVDSTNADLKRMSKELEEVMRMNRVKAAIVSAQEALESGDFRKAHGLVDSAMRLDPTNDQLKSLMGTIQPKVDRAEKDRLKTLNPSEKLKEQGDTFFKAANFEGAIKSYTQCIAGITDTSSDLALKCYGNRAACFKQLSNFDNTIADCTAVLEHRPADVKALVRRAQAFEACERYKSAMQDVKSVISLGLDVAGKASYDLANGMQHRLNRVIAQLKA